jgi:hypothetical protein
MGLGGALQAFPQAGAAGAGAGADDVRKRFTDALGPGWNVREKVTNPTPEGGASQPLPGLGADPQSQQLTGLAALGRIARNPRLQRYFGGGTAPRVGMHSPWMVPPPTERG